MEAVEITPEEYGLIFPLPLHVYNSVAFNELNRHKCVQLRYLAFHERKIRGGIVLGLRDGIWHSPFSAPFGGFTLIKRQRIEYVERMVCCLMDFTRLTGCPVKIVLPPLWYDEDLLSKCVSVFSRIPQCAISYDVSYHYSLQECGGMIDRKARGALKESLRYDIEFEHLSGTSDNVARVYDIVRRNHLAKGYPVKMSCEEVLMTAGVIPADFFVLKVSGQDVAATVAFHVSAGVVQLIYWGDLPGASSMRVMNRMAFELAGYYKGKGCHIMDLGPSTEAAIPNYGLCAFKESWGCRPSLKAQVVINPSSLCI